MTERERRRKREKEGERMERRRKKDKEGERRLREWLISEELDSRGYAQVIMDGTHHQGGKLSRK